MLIIQLHHKSRHNYVACMSAFFSEHLRTITSENISPMSSRTLFHSRRLGVGPPCRALWRGRCARALSNPRPIGPARWHGAVALRSVAPDRLRRAGRASRPGDARLYPALTRPAISRYVAASPNLLAWFKRFNRDLPYRSQVKPFGFLHSLSAAFAIETEATIGPAKRGRPRRPKPIKPIAPYDTDHAKSVAMAFDRETGARVPPSQLRSYAEVLRQYHISLEAKFVNGDYLDRGTTQRRHVSVVRTFGATRGVD